MPFWSERKCLYILTMGVLEDYRNIGIATCLLNEAKKFGQELPDCKLLYLHTIHYNTAAIQFYLKHSFQCVKRIDDFYILNIDDHVRKEKHDALLFSYAFASDETRDGTSGRLGYNQCQVMLPAMWNFFNNFVK